jgi:hypothetical protein
MSYASLLSRRRAIAPVVLGISLLITATAAQAQFGGFLQGVLGAAAQQATNQNTQQAAVAAAAAMTGQQTTPPTSALTPAQANAVAAVATAIPANDPEYQALMAQSLAAVPLNQRAALAPVIDTQVRQSIATRRLGYSGAAPNALAQAAPVNPVAQQTVQNALVQGLAARNGYAPGLSGNLAGDAGKAAAAGALIQGLGSLFSRSADAPAPQSPAPAP